MRRSQGRSEIDRAQQQDMAEVDGDQRKHLLWMLALATFVIFFQAYMMAGGMAFGSPLGTILVPVVGWRGLFMIVGLAGAVLLLVLAGFRHMIAAVVQQVTGTLSDIVRGYKDLLTTARGQRTYGYVLVNSMFQSGVFTWLGVFLAHRYGLGPVGIGLALLGYGVPGFLLGPLIGRAADRWGRARLIPIGLALGAVAAASLILKFPVVLAPAIAMVLSLGYDLTQPLFGGIVTTLGGKRAGQAMGLNVFTLFVGFGLGSLAFGALLRVGFEFAFAIFAAVELGLALLSLALFRAEVPDRARDRADECRARLTMTHTPSAGLIQRIGMFDQWKTRSVWHRPPGVVDDHKLAKPRARPTFARHGEYRERCRGLPHSPVELKPWAGRASGTTSC